MSTDRAGRCLRLVIHRVDSAWIGHDIRARTGGRPRCRSRSLARDEQEAYDVSKREPTIVPRYVIYLNGPVDAEGAADVTDELGLASHLTEYATRAWIINPADGVEYDADADLESHFSLLSALPQETTWEHTNMKVIGIGDGAFFGGRLDGQEWGTIGEKDALVGTLSNSRGAVIELAAISDLAHVNYPLSAPDIWEFFEGYRRDTATGELLFVPSFAEVWSAYDEAVSAGLLTGNVPAGLRR